MARFTVTPPLQNVSMARQLQLLEQAPDWRLDDATRDAGRKGVAAARAALAAARDAASGADRDGADQRRHAA
jgi:hypothetical protein